MKKSIILILFVSFSMLGHAAHVYKTVTGVTAGTLSTNFTTGTGGETTTVTDLTITGTLDATDFKFMRDQLTVLYSLDISGVSIAAYTGTGGTYPGGVNTVYAANALPKYAFFDGTNGKSTLIIISLPTNITTIDDYALKKTGITSITLPGSVTAVNTYGIQGCFSLTSITLSSNLTTIGVNAFSYDTSLTSISLPASLTSLGVSAFQNCSKLATVYAYPVVPIAILVANNVFNSIASTTTLYVPVGSLSAYTAINAWNAFTTKLSMTVSVSQGTLSGFNYTYGSGPSAEQNFTVGGSNLANGVTITPSTNFEISTGTGGSFVPSGNITLNQSGGTVATTTINIRLKAGLPAGSYSNEKVTISSNWLPAQNVSCSGSVTPKPLSISSPTIAPKSYDGSATSGTVTSGTLSGFVGTETVTVGSAVGTFSDANVGSGKLATIVYTLADGTNGGKASNYSLANGSASGDISAISSTPSSGNLGTANTLPGTDVTVASGVVLNVADNATVHSITVQPGGMLTLADGKTLTAPLTLQNTSSATASFIDANSGTSPTVITGTVDQDIPATDRNWYVSVPVSGKTAADITLSGAKIVTRNEANVSWDDVAGGSTLTPGVGYIAVGSTSSGTTSWNLSGNLNSGNVTVPLTASGSSFTGFNLVGNPYPSYLNWEQVLNLNSINAALVQPTIWYRTKVSGSYAFQTYNSASRIAVPTSASGYIPPMQAFWVKANSAGTLTFTNAMRSHGDGSTGFASNNLLKTKSTQNSQQSVLRLQLYNTAANTSDETVLYFNPNAQNGLDAYDSPKMMNNSTTVPDLYTVVGNEKLVINGMNAIPYDTEIPLSFAPGSGTSFQLKATELNNFETGTQILLKDNGTGSVTDLTANDTYTFDNSVSAAGRFSLLFKAPSVTTGVNTVDNAGNNPLNVLIYCNTKNQITVSCKEFGKIVNISVYNTLGQKLAEQQLGQPVTTLHNQFTSGVYMVRVSVSGKSITKKVIVD